MSTGRRRSTATPPKMTPSRRPTVASCSAARRCSSRPPSTASTSTRPGTSSARDPPGRRASRGTPATTRSSLPCDRDRQGGWRLDYSYADDVALEGRRLPRSPHSDWARQDLHIEFEARQGRASELARRRTGCRRARRRRPGQSAAAAPAAAVADESRRLGCELAARCRSVDRRLAAVGAARARDSRRGPARAPRALRELLGYSSSSSPS